MSSCSPNIFEILRSTNSQVQGFSDEVTTYFQKYGWPGNIRELRNVAERALALARKELIQVGDLPPSLQPPALAEQTTNAENTA